MKTISFVPIILAALFIFLAFSAEIEPHKITAAKVKNKHCKKIYTYEHARRAIRHNYSGRRHITRADSATVKRIIRCQRNIGNKKKLVRLRKHHAKKWHFRRSLTDYVITGYSSTFGPPNEGGVGAYGSLSQPCIATRHTGLRGRKFWLTVLGRSTKVVMCDWGPASWTGRNIDITGNALYRLGISPFNYGNYYATARLMK